MSDENPKNRLWDLAVLAAAVTILGIGYTVGQGHSNGLIAFLKEVNTQQKNEIDTLTSQIAKLEREIAINPRDVEVVSLPPGNVNQEQPTVDKSNKTPTSVIEPESNYYEITIQREESARLFDGELVISVAGIKYEKSPLRDTVYGAIGGIGAENITLNGESPGFSTIFKDFEVRILSTSTFSAKFGVSRINNG